jgi:hypothetical protein
VHFTDGLRSRNVSSFLFVDRRAAEVLREQVVDLHLKPFKCSRLVHVIERFLATLRTSALRSGAIFEDNQYLVLDCLANAFWYLPALFVWCYRFWNSTHVLSVVACECLERSYDSVLT